MKRIDNLPAFMPIGVDPRLHGNMIFKFFESESLEGFLTGTPTPFMREYRCQK